MLVVIRNGEEPSLKTNFLLRLVKSNSNIRIIQVYRVDEKKFIEKWENEKTLFATSVSGIFSYFLLSFLKSPDDLRDSLLVRLFKKPRGHVLASAGFFTVLSQALTYYFATSARAHRILPFLESLKSPRIFLIDEFLSIKTVNLNRLKRLGKIIYVSQDVACNRYGFRENLITEQLMYNLELEVVALADIVLACSERDKLKYIEMGAKKAIFYPNIYPIKSFSPDLRSHLPSVSIVLREHWGPKTRDSLNDILIALSKINKQFRVYIIGIKPAQIPRNVELHHFQFISNKSDYLKILSNTWVGINVGIHMAGSNERKYDYAMAGLVVFSDVLGARGDLLPHEYTYVDSNDLAAKIDQLLEFGKEQILEMGLQNRKQALSLADEQCEQLLSTINKILLQH